MQFHTPICSSALAAEFEEAKQSSKSTQMFPPRRGQIKLRIIKIIAAAFSCSGRGKGI
ncbi:hypothetical protein MtrunA17_Chr2g0325891 [Medicago truncatula]|uniref:Uncharacterized protein n=1 Tax=Medicago truncatula TaxID=3880 RepID=A0A396JCI3_MEDTR|nr:hypothetical protein MtrunA17_Chr2g0325891 [Medicago truncatula]